MLADYLMTKGPNDPSNSIIFIAHSLGSRVVLETMAILARENSFTCEISAYLMAAAVPYELVEGDSNIINGINRAEKGVKIFYSDKDLILKKVFALGQRLSSDKFHSEAVGLNGEPKKHVWKEREYMKGFGHESYWSSKKSAEWIAYYLGDPVARPFRDHPPIPKRSMPSRTIDFGGRMIPSRKLF